MAIGEELSSLDFSSMIGGPLNAVIKAQAQSAITSVDFIKSVGFTKDGAVEVVDFQYSKMVPEKDANGNATGKQVESKFKLSVPLLTMLPIPFIRVEETEIDFNAKINSVQESTTAESHDLGVSLGVKGGWGPVSAELKVNYAYKKSTSATDKTERTYSMSVHVKAVQDELPAGTERLLSILENNIKETPQAA